MEQFKKTLEQEKDITDIKLFYNLEGSWVISYVYDNTTYLLSIDMLY